MLYVVWRDARGASPQNWVSLHDLTATLAEVESVGWLIDESDEALLLIAHRSEIDGDVMADGYMVIPKALIRTRQELCMQESDPLVWRAQEIKKET